MPCHRITGEDCILLKIHVADVTRIEKILDRFLAYGQTKTSIVQSSPVPLRPPPLPQIEASIRVDLSAFLVSEFDYLARHSA